MVPKVISIRESFTIEAADTGCCSRRSKAGFDISQLLDAPPGI